MIPSISLGSLFQDLLSLEGQDISEFMPLAAEKYAIFLKF